MIERVFGIHVGIVYQLTGIYLFYYMFGYYLHLYGTIDWRLCAGLLVILESVICISGIIGLHIEIQYNFLIVVATSASLFLMLRNIKKGNAYLSRKRYLCFGIYLIHPLFLNTLYKGFHITPLSFGYIGILLFWVVAFGLSIAASEIMHKMPILKKYI